jgi:hypothetical protein
MPISGSADGRALHHGDAVDFDVERRGPFRNTDDAGKLAVAARAMLRPRRKCDAAYAGAPNSDLPEAVPEKMPYQAGRKPGGFADRCNAIRRPAIDLHGGSFHIDQEPEVSPFSTFA